MMTGVSTCLRCPGELRMTERAGAVAFLECPACGRRYAREDGGPLTERWMGPLSLALYGVIFTDRPQDPECVHRQARSMGHLDVGALVREIRLELAEPTQPVAAVLPGMRATESDLREYLRLLADELESGRDH
jgi:hypothetical protein